MNDLYCASCRMDGDMVAAIVRIQGVPFCRACRASYSGQADILAKVIDWHKAHPLPADDVRIERYGDTEMQSTPTPPAVKHKCICACGGDVEQAGQLIPGHQAKVILAPERVIRTHSVAIENRPLPATLRVVAPEDILGMEPMVDDPRLPPIRAAKGGRKPKPAPIVEKDEVERLDEVLSEAGSAMEDMMEGICKGYGKRIGACGEELGAGNTTGLCKKCYANKSYHERMGAKPKAAKRANGHALAVVEPAVVAPISPIVATAPAKNKLRFVLFEADVDSGNLSQLTAAISQALGVKAP